MLCSGTHKEGQDSFKSGNWLSAELLDERQKPILKGSVLLVSDSEGFFQPESRELTNEKISEAKTLIVASAMEFNVGNFRGSNDFIKFTIEPEHGDSLDKGIVEDSQPPPRYF